MTRPKSVPSFHVRRFAADREKNGTAMHVIRLADTPMITGESKDLRKLHTDTKGGPVLDLPVAWEPHWTYRKKNKKKENKKKKYKLNNK